MPKPWGSPWSGGLHWLGNQEIQGLNLASGIFSDLVHYIFFKVMSYYNKTAVKNWFAYTNISTITKIQPTAHTAILKLILNYVLRVCEKVLRL